MKKHLLLGATLFAAVSSLPAAVVDFQDLAVPPSGFENGRNLAGSFTSRGATFNNAYNAAFDFWEGFSYSNKNDVITPGFGNQYSAYALSGNAPGNVFAVGFGGFVTPTITLSPGQSRPLSLQLTNTTYAALSIRNGDAFAKKFGGASGNDPDFFKLTISALDAGQMLIGSLDVFLADYRFANNAQDYLLTDWTTVDLSSLGSDVRQLQFALTSSDNGMFGINTPTYFALDNLQAVPEPTSALYALGLVFVAGGRRRARGVSGKNMRCFLGSLCWAALLLTGVGGALAGPYSAGLDDPTNAYDAPVPGFVGPHGDGAAPVEDGDETINPNNFVNPLFFGWALSWSNYLRADGESGFNVADYGLKAVTGDYTHVVSLGDLTTAQLNANQPPGTLTLAFTDASQPHAIRNLPGADFVIFENGFYSQFDGRVFAELAYVEVSSDSQNFARFPSVSLTPSAVGGYGSIDPTGIFQLAGKHVNGSGESWGTPFDLAALASHPLVIAGTVDLQNIRRVRLVDIPGKGTYFDSASPSPHAIYDAWLTGGSGGFDLEAIGVISRAMTFGAWQELRGLSESARGAATDPDFDGLPNLLEYAFARLPKAKDEGGPPTSVEILAGRAAISFVRDTRAMDLKYEVQMSATLAPNSWTTIAQSVGGLAVAGVNGYTPAINEMSASHIASVGVLRKVRVSDVQMVAGSARRFLRVKVTQIPGP